MPGASSPGELAEDVLELVEQVPPGTVTTYGDLARLLGRGGARHVGRVMARHGSDVPWWRVVRADGTLPADLVPRAERRWEAEGVPVVEERPGVVRVDLDRCRWDLRGARVPGR